MDGPGHGAEAATAARMAVAELDRRAHEPATQLMKRCHQTNQLTWLGVGNVEGVVLRADPNAKPARPYVLLLAGVVGFQVPSLRSTVVGLAPGDSLVLATDGVRSGFAEGLIPRDAPQQLAERVIASTPGAPTTPWW